MANSHNRVKTKHVKPGLLLETLSEMVRWRFDHTGRKEMSFQIEMLDPLRLTRWVERTKLPENSRYEIMEIIQLVEKKKQTTR